MEVGANKCRAFSNASIISYISLTGAWLDPLTPGYSNTRAVFFIKAAKALTYRGKGDGRGLVEERVE